MGTFCGTVWLNTAASLSATGCWVEPVVGSSGSCASRPGSPPVPGRAQSAMLSPGKETRMLTANILNLIGNTLCCA